VQVFNGDVGGLSYGPQHGMIYRDKNGTAYGKFAILNPPFPYR